MSPNVLLACGCRAMAVSDGRPSCPVHDTTEVAQEQPNLTGREAVCGCGTRRPSSLDLAFFEYCGPGSRDAVGMCVCGYADVAHDPNVMRTRVPSNRQTVIELEKCSGFRPRGARETDMFYCGCRGWD